MPPPSLRSLPACPGGRWPNLAERPRFAERRAGRAGGSRPVRSGSRCTRRSGSATSSGRAGVQTVASGFAALDAELPGGGWPRRVLSELLLPHPGVGEIRLLAPALVGGAARRSAGDAVRPAGSLVAGRSPRSASRSKALVVQTRARRAMAPTLAARCQTTRAARRRARQRQPVGARAGARRAATSARSSPGCRRACAPSVCAACSWRRTATTGRPS